jgi:23S rRNA pseudouridine1911/1915/1917 synthase
MQKIKVEIEGDRIDKFLTSNLSYSRTQINKMLDNGDIVVNDEKIKPSYKVKVGDIVSIINEFHEESDVLPTKMDLNIIYEDEDIMVINKPSGVVVHPGCGNKQNTLANGLMYYTKNLSDVNDLRPGIVHRLDKDTSGIMLVAKSNEAHQILTEDFKVHAVKREYIALLKGVLPNNKVLIDAPIGRDKVYRKKMCVTAENSKNAVTHLNVIKRYKENTLVSLNLETGRTHQIRVHMKYIGYPVFNDPVYGTQKIKEVGQFLHSKTISFVHPITKEKMHFSCPLPDYFQEYLNTLEEI